jgi:hypothetical protein
MAKKVVKKAIKKAAQKRPAATSRKPGQRDLIRRGTASAYAKRTDEGRFTELDDVGRSQAADRRQKAKRTVTSGFGDQGDQPIRSRKRTAKKR